MNSNPHTQRGKEAGRRGHCRFGSRFQLLMLLVTSLLMGQHASAQTTTQVMVMQRLVDNLSFDERGNVSVRSFGGRATGFRYDGLDRLRVEGAPGQQTIELDADGNRLSDGRSRYRVSPGGQRLAERDGVTLLHGPAGHLLSDRAWLQGRWVQRSFAWTLGGQIDAVHLDGVLVARYHYNESWQRTRKTLSAPPAGVPAVTLYRHDAHGRLVMEIAGSPVQAPGIAVAAGQVLVRYIWHDDSPIAMVWPPMTPGNPHAAAERIVYLHADHLNTPRRATDARGVVVWEWASDAFGATPPNEDSDRDGRRTVINLRFPGQYHDAESGLHYNWHRYYDPQVGRYTQSDPIGLEGGINTYAYVGGNPVSNVDVDGLKAAAGGWGGQGRRRPFPLTRQDGQAWGAGCGDPRSDHIVPDFFPRSCAAHDQCYAQQCGKALCDEDFLRNMYSERPHMPAIPWLYFRAVDIFGDSAYQRAASPSNGRP